MADEKIAPVTDGAPAASPADNTATSAATSGAAEDDGPDELVDIGPAANRILLVVAGALPGTAPRPGYRPCARIDTDTYVSQRTAKARMMVSEQHRITNNLSSAAVGLEHAERDIEQLRQELDRMRSRNRFTVCRTPADYVFKFQRKYSLRDFI